MPKMKTNKAALKRFRISSRGKVSFSRAGKSHLLSSKSSKRRRHLRRPGALHTFNAVLVRRLAVRSAVPAPRPEAPPAATPAPKA